MAPWLGPILTGGGLLLTVVFFLGAIGVGRRAVQSDFLRRAAGTTTATNLGAIRALVCGTLLISALWEDLGSSAAIPAEIIRPMGVLNALYALPIGFETLVRSEPALDAFKGVTVVLLLLGMLGLGARLTVPLGAACYLVFAGILRQYAWFYHTGLVPIYVLFVLSFTPCGDGFSLDRLIRRWRGVGVPPADEPSAVYGWSRYLCWTVIALPYVAAGLSKLRVGGWQWWDATNFRSFIYSDSLNPMQFDFRVGLRLFDVPDFVVEMIALAALAGELLFGLVLVSRKARLVLPIVMALMHVGVLFAQNILFFELILLQLVFYDLGRPILYLSRRFPNPLASRQRILHPATPTDRVGWCDAAAGAAVTGRITRLWSATCALLLFCWAIGLEYYPFTAMQMYQWREQSTQIRYTCVVAVFADGTKARAPIERAIGAMADGRYRRINAAVFNEKRRPQAVKFFKASARRYNEQVDPKNPIRKIQIQLWKWDFSVAPVKGQYGELLAQLQLIIDPQGEHRSPLDQSQLTTRAEADAL